MQMNLTKYDNSCFQKLIASFLVNFCTFIDDTLHICTNKKLIEIHCSLALKCQITKFHAYIRTERSRDTLVKHILMTFF